MSPRNNKLNIEKILHEFQETLPKFPDGRIDYSNSEKALVLTCFIRYESKILLLKRSDKVSTYQKMWNSVAGYIDEIVTVEKKVLEELQEEIGITENIIEDIKIGEPYEIHGEKIKRTWITVPCLAELRQKPEIKIDWEHTDYKWIDPKKMTEYDIVPNLDKAYEKYFTK
jgi:isopentenyldiphosphate isomerase